MLYGEKTSSGYWFLNPDWVTSQEMNWLEGAKSVDITCMQEVEGLILRFDPRKYPNFLEMLRQHLKNDYDMYKGKLADGSPFVEVVMNIPHHIAHFWFCINGVIDGDIPAIKITHNTYYDDQPLFSK